MHKGMHFIFISISLCYKHVKFSFRYLLQKIFCAFCSFHRHLLNSLGGPASLLGMVSSTKRNLTKRSKKNPKWWKWLKTLEETWEKKIKTGLNLETRNIGSPIGIRSAPLIHSYCVLVVYRVLQRLWPEQSRHSLLFSSTINTSFQVLWHSSFQAFLNLFFTCIHQSTQLDVRNHACVSPAGLTG